LLRALDGLKAGGNSLFVVEHDLDVVRHADWIVDVGPGAGVDGGQILFSGDIGGLAKITLSQTAKYLFRSERHVRRSPRSAERWLKLRGVTRNNLIDVDCDLPLGMFVTVTGVSGSGKSSLISQALVELVTTALGRKSQSADPDDEAPEEDAVVTMGRIEAGLDTIRRLVNVDQKPIGRTPRSNLATYTGLFDRVRELFAKTVLAKKRRYSAGQFSFNVAKGQCPNCQGEGSVMVELLFLPSVYAPCPACHGARYNAKTLEVSYRNKNIAEVLALTVDGAVEFFRDEPVLSRILGVLQEVGIGYLRLGQPATELSGGEAQRVKLATELQRAQRGDTLYVLDEPTTGLHPADIERLIVQLERLAATGNSVIAIEHDMRVVAASDWVIDVGPGAGEDGGRLVAAGTPDAFCQITNSKTAPYLCRFLG
jgi:excinuclease ABC subunit A